MSNEISAFSGDNLPSNVSDLGNALSVTGNSGTGTGSGDDLLRFGSRDGGRWTYGAGATEVEPDSLWAVNPSSFKRGYVAWKDKRPVGEVMLPVTQMLPDVHSLEDHGTDSKGNAVKWQQQFSVQLRCLNGSDKGVQVDYKMSTVGGIGSIKDAMKLVGARINGGTEDYVLVVELSNDSYNHAEYGKTYVPVLKPHQWMTMEQVANGSVNAIEEQPRGRQRSA